jgi:2,3-dihydroxybenzoate-AMP ligase
VHDLVLRPALAEPYRLAVLGGDLRLTFGELAARVDGAAAGFRALGLVPGDRVLVALPNDAHLLITILGLLRCSAVPVLALPALGSRELRHVTQAAGACAAVVDPRRGARQASLPGVATMIYAGERGNDGGVPLAAVLGSRDDPPARRGDPLSVAFYLLSGGTTGFPKLIPRTHRDYGYNIRMSAELAGVTGDTRYLAALPITHNFALGCPGVLGTLAMGGTVVFSAAAGVPALLAAIAEQSVTATAVVPGMAVALCDSGADLSSLRVLQVGGAKLHRSDASRIVDVLDGRLQQVYGMAEGLLNFTRLDDPDEVIIGTQGRPGSPDDEVLVVSEDGAPVAPGEVGELLVRGPYTIRAYYSAPAANAASFTADGYYRSGDLVRRDAAGNVMVEGRRKEFINRGGEKVSVNELEGLLAGYPGTAQCAVGAAPHEFLGETVCLFVVPQVGGPPPKLSVIRRHLRGQGVARYKMPERLMLLDSLPLTPVGKLDRAALKTIAENRPGSVTTGMRGTGTVSGHLDNDLIIEAPLDLVWDIANDVEHWPELFIMEYAAAEVLEVDGDRKTFRLTTVPDEEGKQYSWVSERIADPVTHTVNARRMGTGPFLYMHIFQHFSEVPSGTRLRWVQDFEVLPGAPFTTEQMAERIGANSLVQLRRHKEFIESRVTVA